MRGKSAPADVRIRGVASSISGFNMRAPCALRTTKHHIEYIVLVLICVFVFHLCSQHLKGLCMCVSMCEQPEYQQRHNVNTDLRFVKKFTRPDFRAKNFTH